MMTALTFMFISVLVLIAITNLPLFSFTTDVPVFLWFYMDL